MSRILKSSFIVFMAIITPGVGIAQESKSILLVIDMQTDILTPGKGGLRLDSSEVAALIWNVNDNIHRADSLRIPIAYIQNEWTNPLWIYFAGNMCRKGAVGTNFDARLKIIGPLVYHKSIPNSFSNKELSTYIDRNSITTIYIAGMKAEGCVGSTARNSMKRGLKTFLIVPAIGSNSTGIGKKNLEKLVRNGAKAVKSIDAAPENGN